MPNELRGNWLRKTLPHDLFQGFQPAGMLVHAGNESQLVAARLEEGFAAAYGDFLKGLEAVANKGRTDHEHPLHATFRQACQLEISVRLQPGIAPEAGLEGDGVLIRRYSRPIHKGPDGCETLSAVAGVVSLAWRCAAVGSSQAMAACRIRFAQMPLRESVKTEEHGCDVLLKKYPDLLRKVYRQHWPELKFKRSVSTIVFES